MTDEACFLKAILANGDIQERLIYADWLEEHGHSRGEFIRVQCELAKMAEDDPRRPELMRRERNLLAMNESEWVGPLAGLVTSWKFRRGFVEEITIRAEDF